jgi:hypothetical protein
VSAGLQPYGFFGSIQSLPVASDATWGVGNAVFRAIAVSCFRGPTPAGAGIAPLMARTIVRAFCASRSYDSTRLRYEFLSLVPLEYWTNEMCEELGAAAESNDQISQAGLYSPRMSAPDAIGEMIGRVARGLPP